MVPEWHEVFVCTTCRFKTPPVVFDPFAVRANIFTGTRAQAKRAGWKGYYSDRQYWFCPECVKDGKMQKYALNCRRNEKN